MMRKTQDTRSLDGQVEKSYVARSTGGKKGTLYDSYYRALRWATDNASAILALYRFRIQLRLR